MVAFTLATPVALMLKILKISAPVVTYTLFGKGVGRLVFVLFAVILDAVVFTLPPALI